MNNVPEDFPRLFQQVFNDIKQNVCREIDIKARELFEHFLNDFNSSNNFVPIVVNSIQPKPSTTIVEPIICPVAISNPPIVNQSIAVANENVATIHWKENSVYNQHQTNNVPNPSILKNKTSQTSKKALLNVQELAANNTREINDSNGNSLKQNADDELVDVEPIECECLDCTDKLNSEEAVELDSEVQFVNSIPRSFKRQKTDLNSFEPSNYEGSQSDLDQTWNQIIVLSPKSKNVAHVQQPSDLNDSNVSAQMQIPNDTSNSQVIVKTVGLFCPFISCQLMFVIKNELDQHLIEFHGVNSIQCQLRGCIKSFTNKTVLLEHIRVDHNNAADWQCWKCGRTFTFNNQNTEQIMQNYSQLYKHMSIYHYRGQFECANCPFVSDLRSTVIRHFHSAHQKLIFRQFAYNQMPTNNQNQNGSSQQIQSNVHSQGAVLQLALCHDQNEILSKQVNYVETPFRCTFEGCSKTFNYEHQYQYHKRYHIKCKRKNNSTSDKNDQNVAVKCVLENTQPDSVNRLSMVKTLLLSCLFSTCQESLHQSKELLDVHLRQKHSLLPHRCLLLNCGRSFEQMNELDDHIQTDHHNVTQWKCAQCERVLPDNYRLHKHLYGRHYEGHFKCAWENCNFIAKFRQLVVNHYVDSHGQLGQINCTSNITETQDFD